MSGELLTDASKATDANNAPYAGAKWFFYATGGLTPQAVYSDAALTTEHTNPVVADSAGKFEPIYFDSTIKYRGILKNADESVTIYDIDPINAAVLSDLAANGGAALVGTSDGSNVQSKLTIIEGRQDFFPEDYGADEGSADNSAAINACDLAAAAAGGKVKFRAKFPVQAQCLFSAPWESDNGGGIVRDWTSTETAKDVNAAIRSRGTDGFNALYIDPGPYSPSTYLEKLWMAGLVIDLASAGRSYANSNSGARMSQVWMECNNFTLDSTKIECGGRDWAFTLLGDGFRGYGFEIHSGVNLFEDGFHVLRGTNGRIYGASVASGDDCFSFGANVNQPVSDWVVESPRIFSRLAFGLKCVQERDGATAAFGEPTTYVENIVMNSPIWTPNEASKNGYARFEGGTTSTKWVRNCGVVGGMFPGENDGLPTGETAGNPAVSTTNTQDCFFEGKISNPSRNVADIENADGFDLDIDSPDTPWASSPTEIYAIINTSTNTKITGRAAARQRGVITSDEDITVENFIAKDIPDSYNGVQLTDGANLTGTNVEFLSAAGATDARGFEGTSASEINITGISGDVNRWISSPTTPAVLNISFKEGVTSTRTVSSGSITTYGEHVVKLLGQGGASDTISNVNNFRRGQPLTFISGESDPSTVVVTIASSGNIAVGSNRALDNANAKVGTIAGGTNFQELFNV